MKNPFSRFVDSMMTSNQKKRVMLQGWLMGHLFWGSRNEALGRPTKPPDDEI